MQETKQLYMKEGFAGAAVGSIITLIVGVGISVLVLIFVGALGGQTYNLVEPDLKEIGVDSVSALSFAINKTSQSLGYTYLVSDTIRITNASNTAQVIDAANFTISTTAGTIQFTGTEVYNSSTGLISFDYWPSGDIAAQTSVLNSIKSSFSALEQTGDYLPIIVLAVVITLVLALVLGMGGIGGSMNRGSAL